MNPSSRFLGWIVRGIPLGRFEPKQLRAAAVHVADRVAARHPHDLDAVMPHLAGRLVAKDPAVADELLELLDVLGLTPERQEAA
ncbi:hypothetical protein [Streptomyces sp. SDr-06]|uniref:hypothetical protein n=1 Tax=Streptomyces sp. SDr-06 TaxID=2267702 RepID=UPI0011C04461|nr:hypothetical protein [Streptomyces sp. SDr-06]